MSNEWAVLPLVGERVEIRADGGALIVVDRGSGEVVGSLVVEEQGEALLVRKLEIIAARRGYGLGSEVARLVRRAAERGRWRTLRAWAPPDAGLAVYYWCRMGLRPLPGEGPEGGICFERVIGRART